MKDDKKNLLWLLGVYVVAFALICALFSIDGVVDWLNSSYNSRQAHYDCDYILNKNSGKFHTTGCEYVEEMLDKNKVEFYGSREDAIDMGYEPCQWCDP